MKIVPYDIGCKPSPSVPAETVIADGWQTFLLFFAVSKEVDESGHLKDLRVAVLECVDCVSSKFGYPNDEGLPEHPLFSLGLVNAGTSIVEVAGSKWVKEVSDQTSKSAKRIWGKSQIADGDQPRHFVIILKEATFECVAKELIVRQFFNTFEEAATYVHSRLKEH
ncbi:MAG: hypothetical protein ACYSYV_08630 [Planctomycetota bacterium]|jgi:hypothetical protein